MKKRTIIIICIIIITSFLIYKNTNNYHYKDMSYAIKEYMTSGFFNSHKLYSVESSEILFSDGNTTLVRIKGIQTKLPHMHVTYKLLMKRNKKDLWQIEQIYPDK